MLSINRKHITLFYSNVTREIIRYKNKNKKEKEKNKTKQKTQNTNRNKNMENPTFPELSKTVPESKISANSY